MSGMTVTCIALSPLIFCHTATAAGTAPWTSCGSTWSRMRKPGIGRCLRCPVVAIICPEQLVTTSLRYHCRPVGLTICWVPWSVNERFQPAETYYGCLNRCCAQSQGCTHACTHSLEFEGVGPIHERLLAYEGYQTQSPSCVPQRSGQQCRS